jgi:rubrerythrin
MARASASSTQGLQFIVDQVGELYGIEQVVLRSEQDIATRTNLPDVRSHLERFAGEDRQHLENLLQVLRMMIGSEAGAQSSIDRGRAQAEAILAASQETAFSFVRGLMLLVFQSATSGRIFMQLQQRIENREIVGLLETNHHEDELHLKYLESQVIRAAEEMTALVTR